MSTSDFFTPADRVMPLPPGDQAAVRCLDPNFHTFLAVEYHKTWNCWLDGEPEYASQRVVRELCGALCLRDISRSATSARLWRELHDEYLSSRYPLHGDKA